MWLLSRLERLQEVELAHRQERKVVGSAQEQAGNTQEQEQGRERERKFVVQRLPVGGVRGGHDGDDG